MVTSPDVYVDVSPDRVSCFCIQCESETPHRESSCRRVGRWYLECHLLDHCSNAEGGATRAIVCQQCFDAFVKSAAWFVSEAMAGKRKRECADCGKWLTRLHHVITDVARV